MSNRTERLLPNGVSLRDYFAAAALTGCLAYSYVNPLHGNYHENCGNKDLAADVYDIADAMLAERNKKQEDER